MAKGAGSTRSNSTRTNSTGNYLIGGNYDPYITDDLNDYYLPMSVRGKITSIENIKTYNDLKKALSSYGISLETDEEKFNKNPDTEYKLLSVSGQKLITGIETYRTMFGNNALSKLKKIVISDKEETATAAYYFNKIGEKDPKAGSLRFKNYDIDGVTVFHELAHAMQDSFAKKGEDAISYSARVVSSAKLHKNFKAYFGANSEAMKAEKFADAFGKGIAQGDKLGLDFINRMFKMYGKH